MNITELYWRCNNVTTEEMIGIVVLGLSSLIGIFTALYRPLNENTKAMTKLTMNIEQLAKRIEEQNKRIEEQERELNNYKDHMRESQKRQWEVLEKHDKEIMETNHNLELCKQQNQKGGNKDV
jgi:septal ring factor EnvC (AmiA/AmiB activator)